MKQEISALMDGELSEEEAQRLLAKLREDEESRSAWETYHVIGDTLRDQGLASARSQSKILASLADEPTVLAPRRLVLTARLPRIAVAATASLAAVAGLLWLAWTTPTSESRVAEVKQLARPAQEAVVPTADHIATYLQAHQDFAPSPVGFRQANFENQVAGK